MNNLVIIRVPSVTFSSKEFNGQTIYHGTLEYTRQVGERLRSHFSEADVKCGLVYQSFKPLGTGFTADSPSGRYIITVCIERSVLPNAEITILAEPRGRAAKNWELFEPLFHQAVESEFSEHHPKWMTVDEFIKT